MRGDIKCGTAWIYTRGVKVIPVAPMVAGTHLLL
jgi:hypothetical protein